MALTDEQRRLVDLWLGLAEKAKEAGDLQEAANYAEKAADVLFEPGELQARRSDRIMYAMNVDSTGPLHPNTKRGMGRATREHPAQKRLYAANVTIKAVAAELGETRARVSSWMADGKDCREIPRQHAEYLRKKYGVPLSAWSRLGS